MKRLIDTFGAPAFSTERTKLIWGAVSQFDAKWFEKVCSEFIGTLRYPPLLPDFQEKASVERERLWEIQKRESARDAREFMTSYSNSQVQSMCKTIRERAVGAVDDKSFEKFVKVIS